MRERVIRWLYGEVHREATWRWDRVESKLDDVLAQQRDERVWKEAVRHQLVVISHVLGALMAKEQDLEQLITDLNDETNVIAAKLDGQSAQIADLKAQIAAGTPVSQAQLDALQTGFAGVSDRLKTLGADPAQPIPPA